MFGKVWTAVVAATVVGLLALPGLTGSAQGATKPAAKPMAMKSTGHKMSHKMGCYDYAWQSAAMNDCLAKGSGMKKPMMKKASMSKKKMSSMPMKKS
jgi:hypothetical protein